MAQIFLKDLIDERLVNADVAVVVKHGSNASAARPNVGTVVMWIGTVAPVNAAADDIVIRKGGNVQYVPASAVYTKNDGADIVITAGTPTATTASVTLPVQEGQRVRFALSGKYRSETSGGNARLSIMRADGSFAVEWAPVWDNTEIESGHSLSGEVWYTVVASDIAANGTATYQVGAFLANAGTGIQRVIAASNNGPFRFMAEALA